MRNGDAYRIQKMSKEGVSESDIGKRFRCYPAEEIAKFICPDMRVPVEVVEAPKPKPKPKPKRKSRAKAAT